MGFATRADLLARSNARRLAGLVVPSDVDMVPDDALRVAITGGDLSVYSAADRAALDLALEAMDNALGDADELLQSYGLPAFAQSSLLSRLASTVAMYYLQGAERLTDDVRKSYEGVVDTLKAHSRGDINLVPAAPTDPVPSEDVAFIASNPGRYGRSWPMEDWL
jgi:phage gp36-like protein